MYAPPKKKRQGDIPVLRSAPQPWREARIAGRLNNFAAFTRMHLLCQKRIYLIWLIKISRSENAESVV
jgi:hypothetical protein